MAVTELSLREIMPHADDIPRQIKERMAEVEKGNDSVESIDVDMDELLSDMAEVVIKIALKEGKEKGKSKWWCKEHTPIECLRNRRTQAIAENDHEFTILFTAMLAFRERMDANPA